MNYSNLASRLAEYGRRKASTWLIRKPIHIDLKRPLISFTFDDFPRSALLNGGAILNRCGIAGTFYASLGLAGGDSPTGKIFSSQDLSLLIQQGHELGCHTYSHCDSWSTPSPTFEDALKENRSALHGLFPGAQFQTFSYPISLPRPRTKAITAPYFLSCRGGGQKTNSGIADLNLLSAFFLEKTRGNLQPVREMIERNRQLPGWLIFATHDVDENPTPYGCTPEFFETVVQLAVKSNARIVPVIEALQMLGVPGSRAVRTPSAPARTRVDVAVKPAGRKPLVSILIPAYNSEHWIADTLRSAIAQTWEPKEIIVVDDGSIDRTLQIAQQFESRSLLVVSQKNQGAAAARNTALAHCRGEYIQWLDADDILGADKIAKQMAVMESLGNKRILLSSEFGKFLHQWQRAQFVPTRLWEDLTPAEWLCRKMGENLYMQTATWLVSRQLTEISGPWDTRMLSDDDGEYFCRVLLNSEGTRFVRNASVYYRGFRTNSLAFVGSSNRKRDALWISMKLHIGYLRSLEDGPSVRQACLTYLQRNLINFYPERADIVDEARKLALELGGELCPPNLSWKYSWIKSVLGWRAAKSTAQFMRELRWSTEMALDKTLFMVKEPKDGFRSDDKKFSN